MKKKLHLLILTLTFSLFSSGLFAQATLATGVAYVFLNDQGAVIGFAQGHVGGAYQFKDTDGVLKFRCFATENPKGTNPEPAATKGFWTEVCPNNQDSVIARFNKQRNLGYGNLTSKYTHWKRLEVSNVSPDKAYAKLLWCKNQDYDGLSQNCENDVYDILSAELSGPDGAKTSGYGITADEAFDQCIGWPATHNNPNDWFSKIKSKYSGYVGTNKAYVFYNSNASEHVGGAFLFKDTDGILKFICFGIENPTNKADATASEKCMWNEVCPYNQDTLIARFKKIRSFVINGKTYYSKSYTEWKSFVLNDNVHADKAWTKLTEQKKANFNNWFSGSNSVDDVYYILHDEGGYGISADNTRGYPYIGWINHKVEDWFKNNIRASMSGTIN